jgi:hypothetical protein
MSISESHKPIYSRKYNNHTNSSFKKLTEMEKKQLEMLSRINRLEHKAKVLCKLRVVTNAILSNCAYHNKNIEEQYTKLEKLSVPKEEMDLITKMWELKLQIGKSLIKESQELINYVESCNNS